MIHDGKEFRMDGRHRTETLFDVSQSQSSPVAGLQCMAAELSALVADVLSHEEDAGVHATRQRQEHRAIRVEVEIITDHKLYRQKPHEIRHLEAVDHHTYPLTN